MKIVVVGAGLGGVAAAVGLHRAGHEVQLFEQAAELREAGTGVVIMPNGIRALDALGAADYLHGQTTTAVNGGLRDWRGRALLVTDATQAQQEVGATVVVARAELHRALRAGLPADSVRTATPIEHLEPAKSAETSTAKGHPKPTESTRATTPTEYRKSADSVRTAAPIHRRDSADAGRAAAPIEYRESGDAVRI
ncbi:FAD-dependent monooxygenase, partial [Acrocarpospora phusangensis]|uniref:FAD-dependent monooxygenase n=1 Tax=Acrocarpospora phusangensis TaxID=1070424 RepID=UPI001950A3DC